MAIKGNAYPFSAPALIQQLQVLSVVESTKTYLSNWIVLLIILTAVARGPIKVGKFWIANKIFSSVLWSFLRICLIFSDQEKECRFWEADVNTTSQIEKDVADLKALLCIICFDLLVSAVDGWDFMIWKLWKVMLGRNCISDSDRDKSTACNKSLNKRWE